MRIKQRTNAFCIHQRKHSLVAGRTANEHNGARNMFRNVKLWSHRLILTWDEAPGLSAVTMHPRHSKCHSKCHGPIGDRLALLVSGRTERAHNDLERSQTTTLKENGNITVWRWTKWNQQYKDLPNELPAAVTTTSRNRQQSQQPTYLIQQGHNDSARTATNIHHSYSAPHTTPPTQHHTHTSTDPLAPHTATPTKHLDAPKDPETV